MQALPLSVFFGSGSGNAQRLAEEHKVSGQIKRIYAHAEQMEEETEAKDFMEYVAESGALS